MAEGAPAHGVVAHLLPQTYKRQVAAWLEEDTPSFDYGGFVVGEELSEAKLLGKSEVSISRMLSAHPDTGIRVSWQEYLSSMRSSDNLIARE